MKPGQLSVALWCTVTGVSFLVLSIPFLASGFELWLGIDWIDGQKLYSTDDAYRYFVGKYASDLPAVFLWNFVMPVALFFDLIAAAISDGSLLGMRLCHAGVGVLTLYLIARASVKAGCGSVLAIVSVLIIGLMPLFLVMSSSFYGEGLFALLLAAAFLFLIEDKKTLLAISVGLLPLVRPEGSIYCILFLIYFTLHRDWRRCGFIAAPGVLYVSVLLSFSADIGSFVGWRLELRKILTPLGGAVSAPVTIDRLPNPLWGLLALTSLLIPGYRAWWPILLGPWCLIVIQAVAIANGLQGFELRYFFSVLPIFGVAWAFPIRTLIDTCAEARIRKRLLKTAVVFLAMLIVSMHALQSDWIRLYYAGVVKDQPAELKLHIVSQDFSDKVLWFDPRPMRAFAGRVDALVGTRENIQTVFITEAAPLYFLDFLSVNPEIQPVLIPHNPVVAAYSGGYFYGINLAQLTNRYFIFEPEERGPALLVVNDAGQDPFRFNKPIDGEISTSRMVNRPRTTASLQTGFLKAYTVKFSSESSVSWSFSAIDPSQ